MVELSDHEVSGVVECLDRIREFGSVAARDWASNTLTPADLGLVTDRGALRWADEPDLLSPARLGDELAELNTTILQIVDSTNSRMLTRSREHSIDRCLYVAEFQFGGRGRRGRSWLSPYARNLAMSLGKRTSRDMSELGGLSVVVGLAVCAELERLDMQGVTLKWPNDVLIDDRKVCGILVELLQLPGHVEFVVGMGVNVELRDAEIAQIDQPVTDLRRHGVTLSRTDLVVRIVHSVATYLDHFEDEGFKPFIEAFNAVHRFHNRTCRLVEPKRTTVGKAVGIGATGELLIQTDKGIERFHGGEVSLRPE